MPDRPHSIRAETLEVEVASEALAFVLQPRVNDLNRQRLLPTVARVLGEFELPGRHVRIDRLALDLGELPLDGLEDHAEAALDNALREAIAAAIAGAGDNGTARTQPDGEARLDLLAHYLRYGTLPFWAPRAFSPDTLIAALAATEPAALAQLIRRHGRDRQALERLVLQLDEATLQSVLRLLEPANAALIIAYMLDLQSVHRAEPLVPLGEAAFARLLWLLSLSYVARDAGTQFNRRSFVRTLLERIAAREAVAYGALVATLERGLRATERHRPLASSLPAVIAEIVRELGHGIAPAREVIADEPDEADPAVLAGLIRRHGHDRRMLERLVRQLDEVTLQAVLQLLEPVNAALIVAYMLDLQSVHRAEPLVPLGEAAFAHLLWVLSLSYVARDAGTQFNRKSFVRTLLERIAASEAVAYGALVATLERGLRATERHRPLTSSLPALIVEIVRDLGAAPAREATVDEPGEADPAALADLIRRHGHDRQMLERLVRQLDEAVLQSVLRLLEPAYAALIVAYMLDLQSVHRAEPLIPLGEAGFAHLLWVLSLSYAAHDAGTQFNRKSFVRALLERIAAGEAVAYGALVATLERGLRATQRHRPLASSLPALIVEIVQELGAAPAREVTVDESNAVDESDPAALADLIRHNGARDLLERLIAHRDVAFLRAVLRLLAPANAESMLAIMSDLERIHGDARLLPLDRRTFGRLQWRGALRYAARAAGAPFDRPSFVRSLLHELAARAGTDAPALMAALGRRPTGDGPRDTRSALDGALGELARDASSDPAPAADDPRRIVARYDRLDALRHYLQRGILPDGLQHAADLSGATLAEELAALGAAQLHALFSSPSAEARWSALLRAAHLLGNRLDLLWRRLLPQSGAASDLTPLRDAIATFAAATPHPDIFHARLLGALLDGDVLDLEALADSAGAASRDPALESAGQATPGPDADARPAPNSAAMRDALLGWVSGTAAQSSLTQEMLRTVVPDVAAAFPAAFARTIMRHARQAELRARWVTLPDSALVRIGQALEPRWIGIFLDAAELMHEAAFVIADAGARARFGRAALWAALLDYLAATAAAERSLDGFVMSVLERAGARREQLRAEAARLAGAAGRHGLVAVLQASAAVAPSEGAAASRRPAAVTGRAGSPRPVQQKSPTTRRRPLHSRTAFGFADREPDRGEPIYIANAGLVLTNPFLPHFFRRLGVLDEEGGKARMRDDESASRAVHLLQYLVDGRCAAPEWQLVLNKLLCGIPSHRPVLREIVPREDERALCDELHRAMIAGWEIIKDSSPAALRETFLKREGRLERQGESWSLHVQRRTVDVLVDRIPWSIAIVYHPWMAEPLNVTW